MAAEARAPGWHRRLARYTREHRVHTLAGCQVPCEHCGALHWIEEKIKKSTIREPKFSKCCSAGKVDLPPIGQNPRCPLLEVLMTHDDPRCNAFRENIQRYNNAMAMTSIGMKKDLTTINHRGVYTIRATGRVTHRMGAFEPEEGDTHNFAQVYLLDPMSAVDTRLQHQSVIAGRAINGLDRGVMTALTSHMNEYNQYVRIYRTAHQRFAESPDATHLRIRQVPGGPDPRRYNLPTDATTEIAAVILNDQDPIHDGRDLWVQRKIPRDDENQLGLHRLSELHSSFLGMHYPLLHPNGEEGWHTGIPLKGAEWVPEQYPLWAAGQNGRNEPDQARGQGQAEEGAGQGQGQERAGDDARGGGERRAAQDDDDDDDDDDAASDGDPEARDKKTKTVTALQWIRYHIQKRWLGFNYLHYSGKLAQEYLIDWYCQIEWARLRYIRLNQITLRAHNYNALHAAAREGQDAAEIGIPIEMPASFVGGERSQKQLYQDSMAIVRKYGQPSYFITMTCNPDWPEIRRELLPTQRPQDRPDLCSRVFHIKLKAMLHDITQRNILGQVIEKVYTIEFQKRGLPHAHCLFIVAPQDRPRTEADVDAIVCAEIPDQVVDPVLYETVTRAMLHGPCTQNSQCFKANSDVCGKRFPRPFREETFMDAEGYPLYRRRNMPERSFVKVVNGVQRAYDNRHVVPYNPALTRKYNCHINVEITTGVRAIKYIHKYIYKGTDRAVVEVQANAPADEPVNEIRQYIDSRYVTAYSACWRILSFPMHERDPAICRLALHLPDQQLIVYNDGDDINAIVDNDQRGRTMLTEFFTYCRQSPHETRDLLYIDAPESLTWHKELNPRRWQPRRGGRRTIGRIYFISPRSRELFYLRMLLHVVTSPKSFEHLRTYDGVVHEDFRSACVARGLLHNDQEWDFCLREAAGYQTGFQLRSLFAMIVCNHDSVSAMELFTRHYDALSDDIARRLQRLYDIAEPTEVQIKDTCLIMLQDAIFAMDSRRTLQSLGLPLPSDNPPIPLAAFNELNDEENRYDRHQLAEQVRMEEPLISANEDQENVVGAIMQSVEGDQPRMFFLQGPGGTGKTFVENHVLAKVRLSGNIALAVASSGIASLLLKGGRTAHTRFKIPLSPDHATTLSIPKESALARLLRRTKLIIWDEAPMQHRHCAEAVDRAMRDIRDDQRPFGGVTIVFGGDWAQTLPVIPGGSPSDIVPACLQRSALWRDMTVLHLRQNMRLMKPNMTPAEKARVKVFSEWLIRIGNGKESNANGMIKFPQSVKVLHPPSSTVNTRAARANDGGVPDAPLISHCYGGLGAVVIAPEDAAYMQYFRERFILAGTNVAVDELNSSILERLPGESRTYLSADSIPGQHEERYNGPDIPLELLNSFSFPGMPLHVTTLKVGAPIILLRNLNPSMGLCNGTRLIITQLGDRLLEAVIITGDNRGDRVFIPRLALDHEDKSMAMKMRRLQFPVKLAFALTINKSQGQSLDIVGLDLTSDAFGHGQLYVALSRTTTPSKLAVLLPQDEPGKARRTLNVVYRQVVQS